MLAVIALLVVGSAGVGIFYYTMSPSTSTSNSSGSSANNTSGGTWFTVNYDTVVVGYNSGLWQIQLQDVGGKQVKLLTAILHTPTESMICTGVFGGFVFSNCPPTPPSAGAFSANMTFTGYASGVGAGSAKAGTSYPISIVAVFSDGSKANDTISVTASSG